MPIPIMHGDLILQHPDDRAIYQVATLSAPQVQNVRRVRPAGENQELTVRALGTGVMVCNGLDGARYEIELQDSVRFQVKVTSQGVVTTKSTGLDDKGRLTATSEVVLAMIKGRVIVKDGQGHKHVKISE